MDNFVDIRVLPDPEFPATVLMNALFAKLHRAFVKLQNKDIGISFPLASGQEKSLGRVIRLHSTKDKLETLQSLNWLQGLRDYTECSSVSPVPSNAKFCRVRRVQVKSSAERVRRRYQKRHVGVTEEDVRGIIPDSVGKKSTLPFLQLKSESTGQHFMFFIEHGNLTDNGIAGEFNCYGLSTQATVPWF